MIPNTYILEGTSYQKIFFNHQVMNIKLINIIMTSMDILVNKNYYIMLK